MIKNPNDSTILASKGVALVQIGKFERSLKYFEKSLEIEPSDYASYLELGNVYYLSENLEKGSKNFHKLLDLKPHNSDTLYNISDAYLPMYQKKEKF